MRVLVEWTTAEEFRGKNQYRLVEHEDGRRAMEWYADWREQWFEADPDDSPVESFLALYDQMKRNVTLF